MGIAGTKPIEPPPRAARGCPVLILVFLTLSAQAFAAGTLQQQIDAAVAAFTEGDYPGAYWRFEAIETDYGGQDEYTAPDTQRALLPVKGYAALFAGRPTDALVAFNRFVRDFDPRGERLAFALYHQAFAAEKAGATSMARRAFRRFRDRFPETDEARLAWLQEAELSERLGETARAAELLDAIHASGAPRALRMQARLRALQIAAENGDPERARRLLLETDWRVDSMPELAALTFAALDVGDLLLRENAHREAVRAYRLALPRDRLLEEQQARLARVRDRLESGLTFASDIWKNHWRQTAARVEAQLARLREMDDYTPGLFLRHGQAYLLGERFREARILFREVAEDDAFDASARAEAHYRWIVALERMDRFDRARDIARRFLDRHPKHDLVNSTLYLIALTYQSEGAYGQAIAVLDRLLDEFPADRAAPRWLLTRGRNRAALENYDAARDDFAAIGERFPESPLAPRARLRLALTHFQQRDYDTAREKLETLEADQQGKPLYPEIQYRIAKTRYAMKAYAAAIERAEGLIDEFPAHHRVPAARALRGDALMGLGELERAANAFRRVPPGEPSLFDYATFQTAKIFRALERYGLLREHLREYVEREDAAERPRVSEALYWIGWSHQTEGDAEKAYPVYEDALERFGDAPKARAVPSILSAYAQLRERAAAWSGASDPFDAWLRQARDEALRQERLTYYARLTLFAARRNGGRGDTDFQNRLLAIHRFVPIGEQGPETLGAVGLALAEQSFPRAADAYFERLLAEFGHRPERARAFHGKALLAVRDDRIGEARRWLRRFLEETPTHPLSADARLLAARTLLRQDRFKAAKQTLDEMLRLKNLRGRPHARALAELARLETRRGRPKRAIAYWQRVYTLYRAFPDLVAEAYGESARLFESIGRLETARATLKQMLADRRLADYPEFAEARAKLDELPEPEPDAAAENAAAPR